MKLNTRLFLLLLLGFFTSSIFSNEYITGNGFRACADYIVENFQCLFNPQMIKSKGIIYIEVDSLGYFFSSVLPQIKVPVILVSHNGDHPAPGKYAQFLDDPRIIKWFGQNCDIDFHPKFYSIPIGIANPKWAHGNTTIFDYVRMNRLEDTKRSSQLYINFSPSTNPIRAQLYQEFLGKPFVHFAQVKPLQNYLEELTHHKFVLSPFGNGLDCHRTWEALLMGCIPVVKTSTLDDLYRELPVIIVRDWSEITLESLENNYKKILVQTINYNKLFMKYWRDLIKSYQ